MSRRTPFDGIDELFDRLDSEMDDVGRVFDTGAGGDVDVDVIERDGEVLVVADVPGFESDEIDVAVADDRLTIAAESDEETAIDDEDARYHRRERRSRSVIRQVRIPGGLAEEAASASYENGVLTVTLPKRDAPLDAGTRIDVESDD